ncbi:spore germination protein [Ectobacillus funiculus]|uniref:spore germination protein n=1 Tax=Ectobacillus funiculus TaxID=137993 RepID=UPI00101B5FB6|nr:spore germination protein [Ectobacillus funiculus]
MKSAKPLFNNLQRNVQEIKNLTGNSSDITIRLFYSGVANDFEMAVIYIKGLTDINVINNDIMKSLMSDAEKKSIAGRAECNLLAMIKDRILSVSNITDIDNMDMLLSALFSGNTVILVDGWKQGISASSSKWEGRGVEEPSSQSVIRGPKEGFVESLGINIALLRRKIKSPNLWVVDRKIGRVTQTDVAVMYVKGIANDKVVEEVLERLDNIDTDSILESGYIEEFIQDETFTPFPTIANSERPDTVAGAILEGQIAILVDGTPFVLLAPVTFFRFFNASEDYYQRYDIASFLRILRYMSFLISILLPSLYIAITTFHQEMLPTTLLISLAAQREGVPFPAFVEAMAMEITFEVLREAGIRMPKAIGSAISIVGALVLGQAAVQAGLVSAAMVIVVSFTAISNFIAPAFNMSIAARLIRFGFMFLAATLGLFGVMSGLIALLIHLAGLRSFGIPYLMPLSPLIPANLKDLLVRVPWWAMLKRPRLYSQENNVRQGTSLKSSPPFRKKEE